MSGDGLFATAFDPSYGSTTAAVRPTGYPTVAAFTQRVYDELPQAYRDADQTLDYPLLRWLSLLGDQGGLLEALIDRIDLPDPADRKPGDTSALVDPARADAAWLPWLGQLVGVRLPAVIQGQAARDAIAGASGGFLAGTKTAVAAAAQSALTGSRHVSVYDHSVTTPGDGGQWDVLLVTGASETPSAALVLAAVTAKKAKPAGVVLHHRVYSATWTQITAAYPTWASRAGKTWRQIQETGL